MIERAFSFPVVSVAIFAFVIYIDVASAQTSRRTQPADMQPPGDVLTDPQTPAALEDTVEDMSLPRPNNQGLADVVSEADEPIQAMPTEPIPQIRRKKTRIDPRYRQENRYIEHPQAEKGLIRIDKDKVYHYRVQQSEQKSAGSLRFGVYEPTNLANPENSDLDFETIYDETNFPLVLYDHEWQFFQKFGKLAWKAGGGFYFAQGTGVFETPNNNNGAEDPEEKFSLLVFPLNVGMIYRAHYFDGQWIVPYAEGGVDAFCFAEVRDDDSKPALGLSPMFHFSVGGSIPLGRKASSFLELDREYGINAMYITLEYRNYIAFSDKYDFSGDAINGGVTVEF